MPIPQEPPSEARHRNRDKRHRLHALRNAWAPKPPRRPKDLGITTSAAAFMAPNWLTKIAPSPQQVVPTSPAPPLMWNERANKATLLNRLKIEAGPAAAFIPTGLASKELPKITALQGFDAKASYAIGDNWGLYGEVSRLTYNGSFKPDLTQTVYHSIPSSISFNPGFQTLPPTWQATALNATNYLPTSVGSQQIAAALAGPSTINLGSLTPNQMLAIANPVIQTYLANASARINAFTSAYLPSALAAVVAQKMSDPTLVNQALTQLQSSQSQAALALATKGVAAASTATVPGEQWINALSQQIIHNIASSLPAKQAAQVKTLLPYTDSFAQTAYTDLIKAQSYSGQTLTDLQLLSAIAAGKPIDLGAVRLTPDAQFQKFAQQIKDLPDAPVMIRQMTNQALTGNGTVTFAIPDSWRQQLAAQYGKTTTLKVSGAVTMPAIGAYYTPTLGGYDGLTLEGGGGYMTANVNANVTGIPTVSYVPSTLGVSYTGIAQPLLGTNASTRITVNTPVLTTSGVQKVSLSAAGPFASLGATVDLVKTAHAIGIPFEQNGWSATLSAGTDVGVLKVKDPAHVLGSTKTIPYGQVNVRGTLEWKF